MDELSSVHPSNQLLRAFGLGQLDAAEAEKVAEHLDGCRVCSETMAGLADDTFVSLVRKSPLPEYMATVDSQAGVAGGVCTLAELPPELRLHPRYQIVELIGWGGMGDVYKAQHKVMNRTVALKVIRPELVKNAAAVDRFQREVQAAARLHHGNIVTAYDAEQAGSLHFLVMEFVDGVDLNQVVQERGPLPVSAACDYIRQAAAGLEHAHQLGMVHRDIKPHNLMLTVGQRSSLPPDTSGKQDAYSAVKILDFGLANFASEVVAQETSDEASTGTDATSSSFQQLTQMGTMMGTPDYIAPEQAADAHAADIRADIYSLGCTLHFLLTGKPPFEAANVLAKLQAHAQEQPPSLTKLRSDVPSELASLVARMIAKNPAERFQTPAEVAAALAPFGKPAESPPRRPRGLVAAALAGAVVLLAGIIIVVTRHGRLEIQSNVDDVQVVVEQDGEQVEIVDLKTGSQVKWLPIGDYQLRLKGGYDNDITLDQRAFTMSRLGKVIVTARWITEPRTVIRAFTMADEPITSPTVLGDFDYDDDGRSWRIKAFEARTVRLFEAPLPPLGAGPFVYRAKLKTENVKGRAYLEMRVRFPGEGELLSKGLHNAVSGTNGWAEYEIPFYLKKGQQPDLAKLNLTIEGSGTVWIKDIQLRGRQISLVEKAAATPAGDLPRVFDEFLGEFDEVIRWRRGLLSADAEKKLLAFNVGLNQDWLDVSKRGPIEVFASLPDSAHAELRKSGYLKWRFADVPPDHQTVYRRGLPLWVQHGEWKPELIETSEVGFAVVQLANSKVVSAFILYPNDTAEAWSTVVGVREHRDNDHPAEHTKQIRALRAKPLTTVQLLRDPSKPETPATSALPPDEQRLQGKWVPESCLYRGKPFTAEQLARMVITFDGNRASMTDPDSGREMPGTFTIDATRSPKHIDLIAPDASERLPGIFEFDGERLKLAWNDGDYARPTDFEPAQTADHMTAVFKRAPGSAPATVPRDEPVAAPVFDETQKEVVKAAEAYLAVMDEGRFGQLRDMASMIVKRLETRDQYSQKFQKLRDTFGKVALRSLDRVRLVNDPPGQPKGRYANVQYRSNFERLQKAWEVLSLVFERDGQWRVVGYAHTLEPLLLPEPTKTSAATVNETLPRSSAPTPPPATSKSPPRAGLLTNPPKLPEGGLPVGKNLIDDPSLEDTPTGQLPKGWFAWRNDGPNFKCEVVEGGVTGKHCLQISGTGTRGVVFATSIPLDRTKRFALKGRVKVEGEAGTWAVIKLNYFNNTGWLGVDDHVGVSSSDLDWKLYEKTDAADKYPAATLLVPTCHIEGNGTAWFDDLEVIAYDREKLPDNFDATHGRNNRMK